MRTWILRLRASDHVLFQELRTSLKRIETRAATPRYQAVQKGDILTFVCDSRRLQRRITRVGRYASVDAMLHALPMRAIMPSVASRADMKRAYAGYPSYSAKIRRYGLVAWHLAPAKTTAHAHQRNLSQPRRQGQRKRVARTVQ